VVEVRKSKIIITFPEKALFDSYNGELWPRYEAAKKLSLASGEV
jgi:hypothetical protein